jgi:DNA-binding beta-propeller fold protein YncE
VDSRSGTGMTEAAPRYRVVEGWERLPTQFRHGDVVGVGVDSGDRVFVLTRYESRCLVYEPDGTFVRSFGEGLFTDFVHALTIGDDDSVYVVDAGDHTVRKFAPGGELLLTLGTPGVSVETGYDGETTTSITRAGPPFNRPTKAAIGPAGDIFVSDGYGNARVHRFASDGRLLTSWGEPGRGPGQFNLPHAVWVADGRVFVADRENDRIQVFSPDGDLLAIWDHVQRPTDLYVDERGLLYVASLPWRAGVPELGSPPPRFSLPGGVYVLDLAGNVLLRWCSADACAPGAFVAPHGIVADSRGDLYVGEVTWTYGVRQGYVPDGCHTLQKFARL